MLMIFVSLVSIVVGLGYIWVQKRYRFWSDRGFVQAKPTFPFGNIEGVGYKEHMSSIITKLYKKHKNGAPMVGMYFFTAPLMLVMDLEIIKHVMVKDFSNFHDRGMYFNVKDDPISGHLFSIEGKEWKDMRAKLTPTFTSGKMKMMFDTVLKISKEMTEYLNKPNRPKEFEMKELLCQYTTDVIGNIAFGLEMNCIKNPGSMFRIMGRKIFATPPFRSMKIFFMMQFREFARSLGLRFMDKDVSDFFMNSIAETVDFREKNGVVRPDFLNLLLQIKNKGNVNGSDVNEGTITFNEMAAQCFLFFIAGFETSSTALTFCLYELSQNIEVQDKLRLEIRSNLIKNNNQLTYETMLEMKYLQMVIDETLRKYPSVDNLFRKCSTDYKVPNTELIIPKDTILFIPAFSIQNDEEHYPNPGKFDPERFSEENKKNRHPMTFLSFGEGPRNCIGMRFGYMQTKIGLIQLISNFKFSPSEKTTIPMVYNISGILLGPHDMWLNVESV